MFSLKNFIKNCSPEWLPVFEHHKKQIICEAKQTIFAEGEKVEGVYFIESGYVKVYAKQSEKENKILRIAGDGMFLGHRGINTSLFPVTAVALVKTKLTFIPMSVFINITKANADLANLLINFLTDELRETEERIKNLTLLDPRQKIAHLFLKCIESFGFQKDNKNKLAHSLSRSNIADMTGVTYETVIRTLAVFEKAKLIKLANKEFEIVNRNKLEEVALGKIKLS
jgi:CRP-like cAMP-binding protein